MIKKFSIHLFIFTFIFSFLPTSSILANIFLDDKGKDTRSDLTEHEPFPLNTIGLLSSGCVATLLSPRIALTASHCVVTKTGDIAEDLEDISILGQKIKIEKIFAKTKNFPSKLEGSEAELLNDWAFLILEDNDVATSLEFMDLALIEFQRVIKKDDSTFEIKSRFPYPVGFVGLDAKSYVLKYDRYCFLLKQESSILYNNCSSTSGGSGGSLFAIDEKTPKIVALMIAERVPPEYKAESEDDNYRKLPRYSNAFANIAIPIQEEMLSTFRELKQAISNNIASKNIELEPPLDNLISINLNDPTRMSVLPRAVNDEYNKNNNGVVDITPETNTYSNMNGYTADSSTSESSTRKPHSILERVEEPLSSSNNNPQGYNPSFNGVNPQTPQQPTAQQQYPQYQEDDRVFELYLANYQKVMITIDALVGSLENLTKGLRRQFLTKAVGMSDAAYNEAIFLRSCFMKAMRQPRVYWGSYLNTINFSIQRLSRILDDLTNHLISIHRIKAPNGITYSFRDLFIPKTALRISNPMLVSMINDVGTAFFAIEKMFM